MLAVEAVLALHDADVVGKAQRLCLVAQGGRHLEVGHGGELDGQILAAGALHADGGIDHHKVAGLDVELHAAAGAHAHEGLHAELRQLLHGDGGRRPADAGGHHRHRLPLQPAQPGGVLPVLGKGLCLLQQGGDFGDSAGVSRQDDGLRPLQLLFAKIDVIHPLTHANHLTGCTISKKGRETQSPSPP